jgi:transcriptional regulator with XRE-family HTH domain
VGDGRGLSVTVRRRRLELRLTQREAAARADVSLATWQSIERAGADASAFQELTLARVAHGLGIALRTLLDEVATSEHPQVAVGVAAEGASAEAAALAADVRTALLRLAAVSEETFELVAGQTLEATDRFLQVLGDGASGTASEGPAARS